MRNIIFLLGFHIIIILPCFGQKGYDDQLLRVVSIEEFEDAFLISTLNGDLDTLRIVSPKDALPNGNNLSKIKIGEQYLFKLRKRGVPIPGSYVFKTNKTIFWKNGDDPRRRLYFADNVKDIYIKTY